MIGLREKLFKLYSDNLKMVIRYGNLPIDHTSMPYICPLCKMGFSKDDIKSANGVSNLTIEHIPPQSVGAKEIVLTCKSCNNEHGSKLDSQFHRKLEVEKFFNLTPGEKMKAEFMVNENVNTRGYFKLNENGGVDILFDGKRTNPKFEKQLIDFVENNSSKQSVSINFKLYNKQMARLSLLRAAYLWAFCKLGYAFIFSKGAERIRRLINEQDSNHTTPMVIEHGIDDSLIGMHIITNPRALRGYLIGMKISGGNYSQNFGVFLPGAYEDDKSFFDYVSSMHNEHSVVFQLQNIPNFDFLKDEKCVLYPINMWA